MQQSPAVACRVGAIVSFAARSASATVSLLGGRLRATVSRFESQAECNSLSAWRRSGACNSLSLGWPSACNSLAVRKSGRVQQSRVSALVRARATVSRSGGRPRATVSRVDGRVACNSLAARLMQRRIVNWPSVWFWSVRIRRWHCFMFLRIQEDPVHQNCRLFLFSLSLSLSLSLLGSGLFGDGLVAQVPAPPRELSADLSEPPEEEIIEEAAAAHDRQRRGDLSESDTEPDEDAKPVGHGPRGEAEPMWVGSFEKRRVIIDGAGICSLGRWPPWARPRPSAPRLIQIRAALIEAVLALEVHMRVSARQLFASLAKGEVKDDPFPAALVAELADKVLAIFDGVAEGARSRDGDRPQPIRVRMLQALLREANDPDVAGMDQFATGIRIGVGVRMPRTPAVYRRKTRWRLSGQSEQCGAETMGFEAVWRDNYRPAVLHRDEIRRQLEDHASRGMALKLPASEAASVFPNLSVNSLNAVEKLGSSGEVVSVRLVMDGTHGVSINQRIRTRDQDQCPIAPDVKRAQREQALSRRPWGLGVDVRDAHRLVQVDRRDWGLQACRAEPEGDVFCYTCGVFGISSIGYFWSRIGGALVRATHHLMTPEDGLWMMLMADDLKLECSSTTPEVQIIAVLLLWAVLGVPIAWLKIQGGGSIAWIGYEVNLRDLSLGISTGRADWAVQWLRRMTRDGLVNIDEFRRGIGRLGFIVGALEWERPFMAPLHAFVSFYPAGGHRPLPLYVRLVLSFLADRIARRRAYPSAEHRHRRQDSFRVDASARGDVIGVGGWYPVRDSNGDIATEQSPWFAVELNRSNAPWAYARGQPYRSIAALEAVAALLAVKLFLHQWRAADDVSMVMRGLSDNRGNRYALSRLQSTKFPLCGVLMELSCVLEAANIRLALEWSPRELNREADRLSNFDYRGFSESRRLDTAAALGDWHVLDQIMATGMKFQEEHVRRQKDKLISKRRRVKGGTLKVLDPW